EILERRQVVTAARRHQLLDGRALRDIAEEALCRRFVGREVPGSQEEGLPGRVASLRTLGRRKGPALLADLDVVAHRDRPGRGRVEDERALAGNQDLVVGRVV